MRTITVQLGAEEARVDVAVDGARFRRQVGYRGDGPWGLTRWTDPADGAAYVVFSGALGGAADLLGPVSGPDDLMPTALVVDGAPVAVTPPAGALLAGHHLGFAAGPWRAAAAAGVVVHARSSLDADLGDLLAETRAALDWLLDFFGGSAPWGSDYAQVLVPDAPWLAMEHPGCVLLSERVLAADPVRRMAVLAHEAAHQWLGNLVSPAAWTDVGAFEGLAELLGQLTCRGLLGHDADPYLDARRQTPPLVRLPGDDPRTLAATAGLAEVAGPAQHAELYRSVRSSLTGDVFRERVRGLLLDRGGTATSAAQIWAALGVGPQEPVRVSLPVATRAEEGAWLRQVRDLGEEDPATVALWARRAFRAAPAKGGRVADAVAALGDRSVPRAAAVGLGAELVRGARRLD
ncbi:hypothetical protein KRR39_10700 [Nocardioides panacis]|uniref:Peptidase M1 membrane alanine aminopeptidase domain-containing protein n=1 Tax=Nocardioides panacis TaxID=2849501 RepID=A0A975Y269_9ACTN|nr:M1 family aminopeptidase [Nocardioides panacis]QWZ10159.1 hypothetical protein KRR39_10700 [Nocardioides panacis]